jgi:hypothetical protein
MTIKDWEDALEGVWIDPAKIEYVEDEIEKKLLCETCDIMFVVLVTYPVIYAKKLLKEKLTRN